MTEWGMEMTCSDILIILITLAFIFLVLNGYMICMLHIIKNDIIDIKYWKGDFSNDEAGQA